MSRIARLVLGGTVVLAAAAPLAPAHAITCNPADAVVCTTYSKTCQRLSTYDQLHQLVCTLN